MCNLISSVLNKKVYLDHQSMVLRISIVFHIVFHIFSVKCKNLL